MLQQVVVRKGNTLHRMTHPLRRSPKRVLCLTRCVLAKRALPHNIAHARVQRHASLSVRAKRTPERARESPCRKSQSAPETTPQQTRTQQQPHQRTDPPTRARSLTDFLYPEVSDHARGKTRKLKASVETRTRRAVQTTGHGNSQTLAHGLARTQTPTHSLARVHTHTHSAHTLARTHTACCPVTRILVQ